MNASRKYVRHHSPLWLDQKGGFPLGELCIVMLYIIALFAASMLGFRTGNWMVVQVVAALPFIFVVAGLVFNSYEDQAYTRRRSLLYGDLVRLLELAADNSDLSAIEDAVKRIVSHDQFPTIFCDRSEELLDLYRQVHSSLRARACAILLRSIPFDLQALEIFLAIPVDKEDKEYFK